jgi:iron complex outermembrane receptor protein
MSFKFVSGGAAPRAALCATCALMASSVLTSAAFVTVSVVTAAPVQAQSSTPLPSIPVETRKKKAKKRFRASHASPAPRIRREADVEETAAEPAPSEKGIAQPLSGGVVEGEAVESQRAETTDTASMLARTPGVSVYSAGGVSSLPEVHGLNDERVNTTVNGMQIVSACGNHMNPALSYVDPSAVHHIDVMAGISPVSAGGDSLGSVISVEAGAPQFAEGGGLVTHGGVSAYVHSNNANIGGSVNGSVATSNFYASYTGSWTRAGNYVDGHGDEVGSTLYEAQNHFMTLAARGSSDVLVVNGGVQKIPYQGFVNQWMDMTDNEAWFVNGRYEKKFDWGKLFVQAYYQHTDHEMEFLDDKKIGRQNMGTMPSMPMLTEGQNAGYKVKAEIPVSARDTVRVGNELHYNTLDDWWPPVAGSKMMCCENFWNINGGERTRLGTFVEVESKWSREWTTLFGVRNDVVWMDTGDVQGYNNMKGTMNPGGLGSFNSYGTDAEIFNSRDHAKTDVNFDVTAMARYEPNATSQYEFGYARKTRSPSLYERYTWSTHPMAASMNGWFGDTNGYVGDIDLDPEIANTWSFTASWRDRARKDWGLKVTPYFSYVQDYINAVRYRDNCPIGRVSGTACGFLPTGDGYNADLKLANHDAALYGVDVSGSKKLWENDYGRFTLLGSISFVHGEDLDTGDSLYHMTPFSGSVALEHKLGRWTSAVELAFAADKDQADPVRNELHTSGYAIVNLRSSYEWEHIRLDFGIRNLFDQYYELPLGGINIGRQPLWRTANPDGSFNYPAGSYPVTNVPGVGRDFYVGLTMKF